MDKREEVSHGGNIAAVSHPCQKREVAVVNGEEQVPFVVGNPSRATQDETTSGGLVRAKGVFFPGPGLELKKGIPSTWRNLFLGSSRPYTDFGPWKRADYLCVRPKKLPDGRGGYSGDGSLRRIL